MNKFDTISPSDFKRPKRYVNKVFIHCSAASRTNIDAKEIDRWHKQRGWSEIGYHFFIKTDGTLEVGRNLESTPAAQGGHNTGTIAICLNGLHEGDFTLAQLNTLQQLCKEIDNQYKALWKSPVLRRVTFHGHSEVSAKSCPVFNYRSVLKLNKNGKLGL